MLGETRDNLRGVRMGFFSTQLLSVLPTRGKLMSKVLKQFQARAKLATLLDAQMSQQWKF